MRAGFGQRVAARASAQSSTSTGALFMDQGHGRGVQQTGLDPSTGIDAHPRQNLSVYPRRYRLCRICPLSLPNHRHQVGLKLWPIPKIMRLAAQHVLHLPAPLDPTIAQVLSPQAHSEQV